MKIKLEFHLNKPWQLFLFSFRCDIVLCGQWDVPSHWGSWCDPRPGWNSCHKPQLHKPSLLLPRNAKVDTFQPWRRQLKGKCEVSDMKPRRLKPRWLKPRRLKTTPRDGARLALSVLGGGSAHSHFFAVGTLGERVEAELHPLQRRRERREKKQPLNRLLQQHAASICYLPAISTKASAND